MDLLAKLNEKVDGLLQKYENIVKENEDLKIEIENCKNSLESKDNELLECREQMALKELELEEVLAKIENIIGK